MDTLRATLSELAAQADESQLSEFSELQLTSPTDDSTSTPEFYYGRTATTSSLGSDSSNSSQASFSSPIGFLQAALPHISTETLKNVLSNAEKDNAEVDMWDVVASILSAESIRELEERGLNGLDEDEDFCHFLRDDELTWETVETKKKKNKSHEHQNPKRRTGRPTKVALVDIRQRQHVHQSLKAIGAPPSDPWTRLSSLSTHLATLLRPHPASLFLSYFHSPNYPTPYVALCSALESLCQDQQISMEQRLHLISDVELAVKVTEGREDDALDLINLLRELDSDSSGHLEMGVYHFSSKASPSAPSGTIKRLPSAPPPILPPPHSKRKLKPPSHKPSPYQWQLVPQRKPVNRGPHPLAHHIPAYARDVNGVKVKNKPEGSFGSEDYRRKVTRKRDELLREAARMWQKGNKKTRGGEVAFYFAERAREFQEMARQETLNAARAMVESRRLASRDQDTVDLHGTTVSEAVVIIKETLRIQAASQNKPLKIITGRGSHSVNQVSVLKPAVRKALVEDGWNVASWDGGLVVRGKHSAIAAS
ncbi:hypothetical protein K443DRAFT_128933 [Laccaria amethystina LaAM-08-1]|uniref:Smr domain-containing protein n=1 Tax=Laccaria amethystina LaAM-08-1 TaxID=1095629 RepID=A0A0C9X6M3_9AGAR|nr:hypothetical protein K443DRAFT_128933 [Laccaria amethystina LaAM-08-1]